MSIESKKLLLAHIVHTFDVKIGMLWIAPTDEFYMIPSNDAQNDVDKKSLTSFLSGFYYEFDRSARAPNAFVLGVDELKNMPKRLVRLAETESISAILISPLVKNGDIRGALLLGTNRPNHLTKIDHKLLRLLADLYTKLGDAATSAEIESLDNKINRFELLIGQSEQIREIFQLIVRISKSDANVLIYGESGTGKEVVARMIHANSLRKNEAFLPIDCVSLPGTLLESELFGYEKGAFTGATNGKQGLIEYAHKGTIFLDEITEMDYSLQSKLLRVLQERQFRPIGGGHFKDINVRIISSTNTDPREAISQKKFREDLYYRLNVIPITLPPLRERKEDIPLLIEHFKSCIMKPKTNRRLHFSDPAMQKLMHYHWPGNVRQLRNIIERLIALASRDIIDVSDLPPEIQEVSSVPSGLVAQTDYSQTQPYSVAKEHYLMEFERTYFSRLIHKWQGNITKVANEARVSRKTIYNILNKHGLNSYNFGTIKMWQNGD